MIKIDFSMIKLVGIHGPLDGGKDTVGKHILTSFMGKFNHYAFAKPLKEACRIMFGFTTEQLEDRKLKEEIDPFWGFSPRRAMQLLGTEYGRDMLRKDVWIKRAEQEINNNLKHSIGTVITDVRFENEAEWLRAQPNSILIYLEVPSIKKDERYDHGSEAGIKFDPEKDLKIINDKTLGLSYLYQKLDQLFGLEAPVSCCGGCASCSCNGACGEACCGACK